MVFSSTVFLCLFLPLVFIFYFIPVVSGIKWKNAVLLVASLFFYAWGEPLFVFLMLVSIMINWLLAIGMESILNKRRCLFWTAIVYNCSLLFVFKYLSFLAKNISWLLWKRESGITIALPIGISFFTFQMMSYIIDVYYGKAKVQKKFFDLVLYISMFPQLIAGPIVRYETIEKEITSRSHSLQNIVDGWTRFVYGLAKKVLLSNYLGLLADNIFNYEGTRSVATAWLGAIAYSLQIFFDFSGYSDMAIGLGKIFGFHFLENFNYPYIASSITDFWRRWHISLSTWFRDYVYIPLGGSRKGRSRTLLNLFVVWLLTGIWHGANWTFLMWGLIYYILLVIEKETRFVKKIGVLSHVYTLFFVVLAWVLFRADSLSDAVKYIGNMFGVNNVLFDSDFIFLFKNCMWLLLISIVLSTPIVQCLSRKLDKRVVSVIKPIGMVILFILSLASCVKATYNPFIYFNF